MKKKPPIRRWLDVSPDYPDETCSAYASLVSFDNVVEGCEDNRDPRFLYISAAALKELVERWRDIHNRDVEPGKCWHADDLEKLLEGE